jgi:hypothetical protein
MKNTTKDTVQVFVRLAVAIVVGAILWHWFSTSLYTLVNALFKCVK